MNIDYHVEYDKRYYSVDHTRIHQRVEVRATGAIVEIFHDGERIASHQRSDGPPGTPVTTPERCPENHRDQLWPPERLIAWVRSLAPHLRGSSS